MTQPSKASPAKFTLVPGTSSPMTRVTFYGFTNGNQPIVYSASISGAAGQIDIDGQPVMNLQPSIMVTATQRYFTITVDPGALTGQARTIGLRTERGGVAAKLYYEICAGLGRLAALERLGQALSADALCVGCAGARVGWLYCGWSREIYYEVKGARPSVVHALLLGGAAKGELVLRSALTQLSGLEYGQFLQRKKLWISLRVRPGRPVKMSVFVDLHEIVRVDADTARLLGRFLGVPDETRLPGGPDGWSYTMCGLTLQDAGLDVAVVLRCREALDDAAGLRSLRLAAKSEKRLSNGARYRWAGLKYLAFRRSGLKDYAHDNCDEAGVIMGHSGVLPVSSTLIDGRRKGTA